MSTVNIIELRRLVERLAVASTNAERAHWWGVHADKVAAYLPILLDELEQLRALTATCSCGASPMTYEGPEPDCPVHGAVRALNQAMAERAVWLPVIEAAREWAVAVTTSDTYDLTEEEIALAAAVDALDRGVSDE